MKIAMLAPIAWRTPPRNYGPWEQVVSNLTEELVKRNIDVTLFATRDSETTAKLRSIVQKSYNEDKRSDPKVMECLHIGFAMEQAHEFDIIHNHFDFLPLTYSRLTPTPMLTTIHGFSSPKIIRAYSRYNSSGYYVAISNSDRSDLLTYMATVYNGINPAQFTFCNTPQDYLLCFNRIHPDKGIHTAIAIAKKSGRRLFIAGLIQDEQYFEERVKPFIDDEHVIYKGNAGPKERDELLRNAFALLHPIRFDEPFGLSVAEAMMCGTPVIAFNRGSMPELIVDGKTGFLVDDVKDAAEAVTKVAQLNRGDCRSWSMENFSAGKMADNYVKVYEHILLRQKKKMKAALIQ
jgi:glycosyltransferase involved in cell wall biosynthesis